MKTILVFAALFVLSACSSSVAQATPVLTGGARLRQEGLSFVNRLFMKCGEDYFIGFDITSVGVPREPRRLWLMQGKTLGIGMADGYIPGKELTQADKLNNKTTPNPDGWYGSLVVNLNPGRWADWSGGKTLDASPWFDDYRTNAFLHKSEGEWSLVLGGEVLKQPIAIDCAFAQSVFDNYTNSYEATPQRPKSP